MKKLARLVEYLLITGIVWGWYATTLPLWMHYFIGMTWDQIIIWWWQGSIVEMFLAYPIGKFLIRLKDPIDNIVKKIERG